MTTASTSAPVAHTLNPAIFLAEFVGLGGGYCLTPDGQLCLGVLHGGDGAQDGAKVLEAIQRLTPADKDGIKAHLAGGGGAASRALVWADAMACYETAQRNYANMLEREQAGETIDHDEDNRIGEVLFDARMGVLSARAPNRAALMWKLEQLLSCPDGAVESWTSGLIAPTMEDLRTFLIGDGKEPILDLWAEYLAAHNPVLYGTKEPEEAEMWKHVDAIEERFRTATAKTLQGVILQLRIALSHLLPSDLEQIALHELPALFEQERKFDWPARMVMAAVRSLEAMEA